MQSHFSITGPVVTEKAEAKKAAQNVYTLRVRPLATKIDVKNDLERHFDVSVESVRVLRTTPKVRSMGQGRVIEKRHREKRMMVTLKKDSKALDLANFRVI